MSDISGVARVSASPASGLKGEVDNLVPTIALSDAFEGGFYESLGRVAVAFGRLEYFIVIAMKRLRQADRQARSLPTKSFDDAVLNDIRFDFKKCEQEAVALFASLVADGPRRTDFTESFSKARLLWENERNDCLHCCWTAAHDGAPMRLRPEKVRDPAGNLTLTWAASGIVRPSAILQIARDVDTVAEQIRQATRPL